VVLVGGGDCGQASLLLGAAPRALALACVGSLEAMRPSRARLQVHNTTDVEWARGAASLVLRELFRAPIYETGLPLAIDDLLRGAPQEEPANSLPGRR